ncbi:MAG: DUF4184 family protein [Candidatus Nanopelagicales bacterium]
MPFTVSHAAAVLPIRVRWLSSSALVIGAMTPDLPLFAPFLPYTTDQTHTVFATLITNTVVGLALFVLWHGFFARPADWFAPSAIRWRLAPAQQPGLRVRLSSPEKVAGVVGSLVVGGLTHQFLDWFTHAGTVVTDRFDVFGAEAAGMPLYYFLQIALSVVGLVLLAARGVKWFNDAPTYSLDREPSILGKIAARATVLGGAVAATAFTAWTLVHAGVPSGSVVFAVSVAPVAAAVAMSSVIAMIWHLNEQRSLA